MTDPIVPESVKLETYRDVVQPSAQEVGKSLALAVRVALAVPSLVLRPIEATLNEVTERVLRRLEARNAAADDVRTPVAEVAAPAIGRLRSPTLSAPLQDMFIELLATASLTSSAEAAHPAFVGLIGELSSSEAALLDQVSKAYVPALQTFGYIDVLERDKTNYEMAAQWHSQLTLLGLDLPERVPATTVDNFLRIGLIEVRPGRIANEEAYTALEGLPEVAAIRSVAGDRTWIRRGTFAFTSFGSQFLNACTDPLSRARPQFEH